MTFIRGKDITLRVLEDKDCELFTQKVNEGLTTQHLFTGSTPMRTKDYLERWNVERSAGDILFGIQHNELRSFIGTCGLHSHRDIYQSWEARFLIFDAQAVGRGFGKEACRLLVDYAFKRLNAHRVWLGVSEHNVRAVKCYLDCGFVFEGRERDAIFYEGRYFSTLKMSILEHEWTSITTVKV